METRGRSAVKLAIDKNVPVPAYQQVVDGISDAVAKGELTRGARLPSVRHLAEDLNLNVNTVARAYRDLERAGVVNTMPGMGTFVAPDGALRAGTRGGRGDAPRAIPATGAPLPMGSSSAPLATSWRDLVAAAHALAGAEGVAEEDFLSHAGEVARAASHAAPFVACAASRIEASDMLRAMPADIAALSTAWAIDDVPERLAAGDVAALVTTFPSIPRLRARLGEAADRVTLIPVETEFTESTVRALAALPPNARLALVTMEKERWDEEANDVMKIIGRHRWLKMVLLENGERGLAERLEHLDAILFVARARDIVEPLERPGQTLIELSRQLTARTRERLVQAAAAAG
jgi:hypothetical protein